MLARYSSHTLINIYNAHFAQLYTFFSHNLALYLYSRYFYLTYLFITSGQRRTHWGISPSLYMYIVQWQIKQNLNLNSYFARIVPACCWLFSYNVLFYSSLVIILIRMLIYHLVPVYFKNCETAYYHELDSCRENG